MALRWPPLHHSHPHRHLVGQAGETHLGLLLGHAAKLEQDSPLFHDGDPSGGLALAGAHAGFQRAGGDRLVRKDADVKTAFAADVLLRGNTPRLDRRRPNPAALSGLQPEIAKDNAVAPLGLTFYTSSLVFSVLHSLGHQRHRCRLPRTFPGSPTPARPGCPARSTLRQSRNRSWPAAWKAAASRPWPSRTSPFPSRPGGPPVES